MARYFIDPYPGGISYSSYLSDDPEERPAAMLNVHKQGDRTYTHIKTPERMRDDRLTLGQHMSSMITFDKESIDHINSLKTDIPGFVSIHESGMVSESPSVSNTRLRPARENEQLQMFYNSPESNHSVDALYSRDNPGARISAMTMLGMADLHSRARTGQPLAPSTDLSPHSMRIVRHLADAGVIDHPQDEDGYDLEPSNSINFHRATNTLNSLSPLSDADRYRIDVTHQSRQARRHVTNLMRLGRGRKNQPIYSPKPAPVLNDTQLKLFED